MAPEHSRRLLIMTIFLPCPSAVLLKNHSASSASRPCSVCAHAIKSEADAMGSRAGNATQMFSSAAEGQGRKTSTVGKVIMAALMGAVLFHLDLMSSSCAVFPISSQDTYLFDLCLRPKASRAMYSLVLCSVF